MRLLPLSLPLPLPLLLSLSLSALALATWSLFNIRKTLQNFCSYLSLAATPTTFVVVVVDVAVVIVYSNLPLLFIAARLYISIIAFCFCLQAAPRICIFVSVSATGSSISTLIAVSFYKIVDCCHPIHFTCCFPLFFTRDKVQWLLFHLAFILPNAIDAICRFPLHFKLNSEATLCGVWVI